jgi:hypothetical protein
MTNKELLKLLKSLSPEQLAQNVIVYDPYTRETLHVVDAYILEDGPAEHRVEMLELDKDQPILMVGF